MDRLNFVKVFNSEKEANMFAATHKTKPTIQYNWNSTFQKMEKQYVVKFKI